MQYDHRVMGKVIRQQQEKRALTQEVFGMPLSELFRLVEAEMDK